MSVGNMSLFTSEECLETDNHGVSDFSYVIDQDSWNFFENSEGDMVLFPKPVSKFLSSPVVEAVNTT